MIVDSCGAHRFLSIIISISANFKDFSVLDCDRSGSEKTRVPSKISNHERFAFERFASLKIQSVEGIVT